MYLPDPLKIGFYKVEYTYMGKTMFAVFFALEEAQEAMMKMIKRGVNVIALHNHKPLSQIMKTVR